MKLAIISHTEHYTKADGSIVGWGPTISEINYLAPYFTHIYHIAMLYKEQAPPSALAYKATNVTFIALPPSGGKNLFAKLSLVTNMPKTIKVIKNTLKEVDCFQLRTPTGIGVYLIPYLTRFVKKKGWYKYAGNWNQKKPPLGYALQRNFLKRQSRTVTINGNWPDQPSQCLTFENPCLTNTERAEGLQVIEKKQFTSPFSFCFVGRLEDEKGVQRIIDAVAAIEDRSAIEHIHFVGNGAKFAHYKEQCNLLNLPVTFHGFLSRDQVFDLYRTCSFLLLPSTASEGFPKVIAEAMNFGCIPIVSSVSSIGQYITYKNGFVVNPMTTSQLETVFLQAITSNSAILRKKVDAGYKVAQDFTFERYNQRIFKDILECRKPL